MDEKNSACVVNKCFFRSLFLGEWRTDALFLRTDCEEGIRVFFLFGALYVWLSVAK